MQSPSIKNLHLMADSNRAEMKGVLRLNGRHLGNSPQFSFEVRPDGKRYVHFTLEEFTRENVNIIYCPGTKGILEFEPKNEHGPKVTFSCRIEVDSGVMEFLTEDWSKIKISALCDNEQCHVEVESEG